MTVSEAITILKTPGLILDPNVFVDVGGGGIWVSTSKANIIAAISGLRADMTIKASVAGETFFLG